eukprot:2445827-Pyramimonas_sp.AAC.1
MVDVPLVCLRGASGTVLEYLVIQRSMRKRVSPLHSPPPPPLRRVIHFSRVPGISLFWGSGSLAGPC